MEGTGSDEEKGMEGINHKSKGWKGQDQKRKGWKERIRKARGELGAGSEWLERIRSKEQRLKG